MNRLLPRVPLHDLTGNRVDPQVAVAARELDMGEELRRLTFELSRQRVQRPAPAKADA